MNNGVKIEIQGMEKVAELLSKLPDKIRNKVINKGLQRAARNIERAAEANLAPHRRSGTLRKAIAKKIKKYKTGISTAIIGVENDRVSEFKGKTVRPAKYSHLVELGTKRSQAVKFMERAFNSQIASIQAEIINELQQEIDKL